jgi:hypothetical protein
VRFAQADLLDRNLEIAVIDYDGPRCRVSMLSHPRQLNHAETQKRVDVRPTHCREWQERC